MGRVGWRLASLAVDLDDHITLANAEGIDLDLALAGIGSRGSALIIDLALQALALFAVAVVGSAFGDAGLAITATGGFLILLGYPILAEAFAGGQTVGKRMMGITVVMADGSPVTFLGAVVRNLVRLIDSLPGVYVVGMVAILATARNQRVGDLAAGTLVVRRASRPSARGSSAAFDPAWSIPVGGSPDAGGWDVSAVTAEEVAAIRSFLGRRAQLDPMHRAQLAQTLSFQILPKVAGVPLEGGPEHFLERIVSAKTNR